jgi:hypothetical protein
MSALVPKVTRELTRMRRTLRETFNLDKLRPGQAEVIRSVLEGNNTLAIMPTGTQFVQVERLSQRSPHPREFACDFWNECTHRNSQTCIRLKHLCTCEKYWAIRVPGWLVIREVHLVVDDGFHWDACEA